MGNSSRRIDFPTFCEKVLHLTLTLGQRVIAKVAFGGYDPIDLEGDEREIALAMFGGVERVAEPKARRYVVLRLGRGSGKTTLCAAYAVYEAVTHDVSKCGPGDVPYVITIAPDKETAKLSVRMAREMVRGQPALERLVVGESDQIISIRRPDGRMVRIEAFAASRGGSSVRGRTIIAFLLDEAEFFTSNTDTQGREYSISDRDIFNALTPRLLRDGRGMLVSTPWPIETLMGTMFEENWGNPKTAVSVKATTLQVRGDDADVVLNVETEIARDPENARREYFCEIDGMSGGEFFDTNALTSSLDTTYGFPQPFNPKWPVAVGCDFGFTRDSSAIVVVQWDGMYYRTVFVEEHRPKPGQPLKFGDVIQKFAEISKRYGVSNVISDGYYREAVAEKLLEFNVGIIDAPTGAKGKAEVFQRTRSMLNEGYCKIPDVTIGRRMVQQAKLVSAKPSPGGTVTIKIPRKVGLGHGDLVSAWTLAVHHLAHARLKSERVVYEPGTPEWIAESTRRILSAEEKRNAGYLKGLEKAAKRGFDKYRLKKLFSS